MHDFEHPELKFSTEEIAELAKEYERQGKFNEMLGLVENFNLPAEIFNWAADINKLLKKPNTHTMILQIIKNYAPDLQRETINRMATNQLCKYGADFIKKLNLDPQDYPEMIERISKKSMRYHLSCYWKKDKDHVPLWKIEDMLSAVPQI